MTISNKTFIFGISFSYLYSVLQIMFSLYEYSLERCVWTDISCCASLEKQTGNGRCRAGTVSLLSCCCCRLTNVAPPLLCVDLGSRTEIPDFSLHEYHETIYNSVLLLIVTVSGIRKCLEASSHTKSFMGIFFWSTSSKVFDLKLGV